MMDFWLYFFLLHVRHLRCLERNKERNKRLGYNFDSLAKWKRENPEKAKAAQKRRNDKLKLLNPKCRPEANQRWRDKHPEYVLKKAKSVRERMTDGYVADAMSFKVRDVPKALLDAKRVHIKIKRLLKEKQA